MISNSLKKRFVKDFSLPIDVFEDEHFLQSLELYEKDFFAKTYFNHFCKLIESIGEKEFLNQSDKIISDVQNKIKSHSLFNNFQSVSLTDKTTFIQNTKERYLVKKNFYIENNIDRDWISIDLKSANFTVIKEALKLKYESYYELLYQFTSEIYFLKSKQIRQIIFGGILPKKQAILMEYMMCELINQIQPSGDIYINKDEIIFEKQKINYNVDPYKFHITEFTLKPLRTKSKKLYFVKESLDKKELKTVPKSFYRQAYKTINNLSIEKEDLLFFHDGFKAYYEECVFS